MRFVKTDNLAILLNYPNLTRGHRSSQYDIKLLILPMHFITLDYVRGLGQGISHYAHFIHPSLDISVADFLKPLCSHILSIWMHSSNSCIAFLRAGCLMLRAVDQASVMYAKIANCNLHWTPMTAHKCN